MAAPTLPNRQTRRARIAEVAQRPDAAQRFAADMQVATSLHKEGRLKEAVNLYRKIAKVYEMRPEVRVAWSNLGAALQGLNKLEDAVLALKKARALNPNQAAPQHNLGIAQLDLGRTEEGLESLARAIALEPRFGDAWAAFIGAAEQRGDIARIADMVNAALAADPEGLPANITLGNLLRRDGRLEDAEAQYRRCIALSPVPVEPFYALALVLLDLGREAEAAENLLETLRRAPGEVGIRQTLVEVLTRLKATDAATAASLGDRLAALYPGDEGTAKLVADIKAA